MTTFEREQGVGEVFFFPRFPFSLKKWPSFAVLPYFPTPFHSQQFTCTCHPKYCTCIMASFPPYILGWSSISAFFSFLGSRHYNCYWFLVMTGSTELVSYCSLPCIVRFYLDVMHSLKCLKKVCIYIFLWHCPVTIYTVTHSFVVTKQSKAAIKEVHIPFQVLDSPPLCNYMWNESAECYSEPKSLCDLFYARCWVFL